MREYVILPRAIYTDHEIFTDLLTTSNRYVSSLPPKEQQQRRQKPRGISRFPS